MYFELSKIDWTAIAAIVTFLSTIGALYLGLRNRNSKLIVDGEFNPPYAHIVLRNVGDLTITIEKAFVLREYDVEPIRILLLQNTLKVDPENKEYINYETEQN